MTKYHPDLRHDASGPPDAVRGFNAIAAWIDGAPLGLAMRSFTTDADVRCAINYRPEVIYWLRPNPGPYAQHVAEADSAEAALGIEAMLRGAAQIPRDPH